MKQERITRPPSKRAAEPQEIDEVVVEDSDAGLLSDIDELLDEIDSVLEDQSVLVGYRQRSGQ
jgi:hypothetical protein